MDYGKCLGYSSTPCPNCGRQRLEQYESGKDICEKCHWCPQEQRYVESDGLLRLLEDNDILKVNEMKTQIQPTPIVTGDKAKFIIDQITSVRASMETERGKQILFEMFKDKEEEV